MPRFSHSHLASSSPNPSTVLSHPADACCSAPRTQSRQQWPPADGTVKTSAPGSITQNTKADEMSSSSHHVRNGPKRLSPQSHRRTSSQSLKLDLDGLDLGGGGRASAITDIYEGQVSGSSQPASSGTSPSSGSSFHAPKRAAAPQRGWPKKAINLLGEDSFAQHLRKCEDANDIRTLDSILQGADQAKPSKSTAKRSTPSELDQQVLGGFASLGPVDYQPTPSTSHSTGPLGHGGSTSTNRVASLPTIVPFNAELPNSWASLTSIPHDPTKVLDIPSIDEMGLHSINVGSAQDWDGTVLAALDASNEGMEAPVQATAQPTKAEWAIARSRKLQRKWIVAPVLAEQAPERTIVVSDHVVAAQDALPIGPCSTSFPSPARPVAFSGQAVFELRYLQAGTGAPSFSIQLADPATQRELQRSEEDASCAGLTTAMNREASYDQHSLSDTSVSGNGSSDLWPAIRHHLAVDAALQGSSSRRPSAQSTLTHTRSASTILAPSTPVQIESRRPSLGKSISHDGLDPDRNAIPLESSRLVHQPMTVFEEDPVPTSRSTSMLPLAQQAGNGHTFGRYAIERFTAAAGFAPIDDSGPSPRSSSRQLGSDNQEQSHAISPSGMPRPAAIDPAYSSSSQSKAGPLFSAHAKVSSPLSSSSSQGAKRDKRLSGWLRRKVKPNSLHQNTPAPPVPSPPLPSAQHKGGHSVTPASQSPDFEGRLDLPALTGGYQATGPIAISSKRVTPLSEAQPLSEEFSSSFPSASPSSPGEDERPSTAPEGRSLPDPIVLRIRPPPPNAEWRGVQAALPYRRRSNSSEASGDEASRARQAMYDKQALDLRRQASNIPVGSLKQAYNGFSAKTSASTKKYEDMFAHSIDNIPPAMRDESELSSPHLTGIDDVPGNAMTMLIPLPIRSDTTPWTSPRYLRVSFIPFDANTAEEGGDQCVLSPGGTPHVHGSAWYRRLASAWIPSTGQYSGIAERLEDESGMHGSRQHQQQFSLSYSATPPVGGVTGQQKRSQRAFRITAKMLVGRTTYSANSPIGKAAGLLPPPSSFPVILGICDGAGCLELLPEGWHSIGIGYGPAGTHMSSASHPLCGVADLIIAGCAACMDL